MTALNDRLAATLVELRAHQTQLAVEYDQTACLVATIEEFLQGSVNPAPPVVPVALAAVPGPAARAGSGTKPSHPSQPRAKRAYTLEYKQTTVAYSNEHGPKAAAEHFGVHRSLVIRWRAEAKAGTLIGTPAGFGRPFAPALSVVPPPEEKSEPESINPVQALVGRLAESKPVEVADTPAPIPACPPNFERRPFDPDKARNRAFTEGM